MNIEKTEIMVIEGRGKYFIGSGENLEEFYFRENTILALERIKYLGVLIDKKLTYEKHFLYLHDKCEKIINRLKIVCPNISGYGNKARRIIYDATVGAIWRYASTVFVHRLVLKKNIKIIRSNHRRAMIACTRAYRTVGYLPLTLLAGWPPMEYEIIKRSIKYAYNRDLELQTYPLNLDSIFENKNRNIKEVMQDTDRKIRKKWEDEWAEYRHDCTTKILFPSVKEALDAPVFSNFFLTQALSGHGCQKEYRHRINKVKDPYCPSCPGQIENTMHVIRECTRFSNERPKGELTMNSEWFKYMVRCFHQLWINENGPVNDIEPRDDNLNLLNKIKKTKRKKKGKTGKKKNTKNSKCSIS